MIVTLLEPQIPPNTGNIARLCAATKTPLHLVGKLGFDLSEKQLRRAGLDYWPYVDVHCFEDIDEYLNAIDPKNLFLFSARATRPYTEIRYSPNARIVFGHEKHGISQTVQERFASQLYTIPMAEPKVRSLNLATSVGIVLYDALFRA